MYVHDKYSVEKEKKKCELIVISGRLVQLYAHITQLQAYVIIFKFNVIIFTRDTFLRLCNKIFQVFILTIHINFEKYFVSLFFFML